ncbi:RNA pyrophosphohydrolase [Tsuneonella mangrovi]|uniref:RNA pyrophosphohydrolase n=1 Tax=Tsuneonella mangrovi TaxID=1982042 RepID=UPI000BA282C8|nr:RNA pyrophosphohydrolase [Tsuneonella mangrovi]
MNDLSSLPYRPCVGVMLVNQHGKAFVGMRIDNRDSGFWQMPQGGIDRGEDPVVAMHRELAEETGVVADLVSVLKQMDEPLRYDLPDELLGKLWGGKYRGQEQTWFLARFHGPDEAIDLAAHSPPEFCEWKWADPEQLPDLIVPFKKRVYRAVLEEFRDLI